MSDFNTIEGKIEYLSNSISKQNKEISNNKTEV